MKRRFRRGQDCCDGVSRLRRVTWLSTTSRFASLPDRIENRVIVAYRSLRTDHRPTRPIRPEHSWFDCGHVDAQRPDFLGERRRNALEGKFAAVVVGESGHGHQSAHRSDVQNSAFPPQAHVREDCFYHGHGSKHIHFKLLAQLIHRAFLQCAFGPVAGVVDERVHRSNRPLDFFDNRRKPFRRIGHIKDASECPSRLKLFEFFYSRWLSHSAHYFEPCLKQGSRKSFAESAADAGHHHYFVHYVS